MLLTPLDVTLHLCACRSTSSLNQSLFYPSPPHSISILHFPAKYRIVACRTNIMQSAVKMLLATWAIFVLLMPRASMSATAFVNASQGPEALATRTYFYVGGGYVDVLFPPALQLEIILSDPECRTALACISLRIRCTSRNLCRRVEQGESTLLSSYTDKLKRAR